MKYAGIILLVFLAQTSFSQNLNKVIKRTKSFTVIVDPTFDEEKTLSIGSISKDYFSIVPGFRDEMLFNGFQLTSDLLSTDGINIESKKSKVEIYRSYGVTTDYFLEISYTTDVTVLFDDFVESIQGEIIDLTNGGKIVCSFRYRAKRPIDTDDVTRYIVSKIKEGKNFRL